MFEKLTEQLRNLLFARQHAYRTTFRGPVAETVLIDLARFCRASESTHAADSRDAARLDGRREVWLRIQHHMNLSPEDLWRLYAGKGPASEAENVSR